MSAKGSDVLNAKCELIIMGVIGDEPSPFRDSISSGVIPHRVQKEHHPLGDEIRPDQRPNATPTG